MPGTLYGMYEELGYKVTKLSTMNVPCVLVCMMTINSSETGKLQRDQVYCTRITCKNWMYSDCLSQR